jgi:hypothetical protein
MKRSELKQLIKEIICEGHPLKWQDGVTVNVDWSSGKPTDEGWIDLGTNPKDPEARKLIDTNMKGFRRGMMSNNGNHEVLYNPEKKLWYQVDSSG